MDSPGKIELFGSKALLLGYGAIGKLIEERLKAFAVDVTLVDAPARPRVRVTEEEAEAHAARLAGLQKKAGRCLWLELEGDAAAA